MHDDRIARKAAIGERKATITHLCALADLYPLGRNASQKEFKLL